MKIGETIAFRDRLLKIFLSIYLIIFWKFHPKKGEKFGDFEIKYALIPKILFSIPRSLQKFLVKEGKGLAGASVIFQGKPLIFIPSDTPIQYRRFSVFHEWIEWKELSNWSKGISLPDEKEIMDYTEHFGKSTPMIMAHDHAVLAEEMLAKGEFSEKEFLNFSQWKKSKTGRSSETDKQ